MDLARAPCRAPLTARKKGSGYENETVPSRWSRNSERPGTSCKIEIHFWFKITQYLINGIRFQSQICLRYSFPCARHRHKVSNSFTKEPGRDKWLKVRKLDFYSVASPSPFAHLQITWISSGDSEKLKDAAIVGILLRRSTCLSISDILI
jgi:hypothetical protein